MSKVGALSWKYYVCINYVLSSTVSEPQVFLVFFIFRLLLCSLYSLPFRLVPFLLCALRSSEEWRDFCPNVTYINHCIVVIVVMTVSEQYHYRRL